MAFDRNNPADLAALKSEVVNDPLGIGYNAQSGNTVLVLSKLNNASENLGGETGQDIVTVKRFMSAIFAVAVSSQDQFKIQLLIEATNSFEDDISEFKADLSDLSSGIATALNAITRPLSRAEALFSDVDANGITEVTVISKQDWIAARDS